MSEQIKTWQDRASEDTGRSTIRKGAALHYAKAEITDLRARIAELEAEVKKQTAAAMNWHAHWFSRGERIAELEAKVVALSRRPAAAAEVPMVDCGDCEGSGRISPVELCQRFNESGILPSRAEVAAEQPKLRHSEAYVADLEDSLKQVASLLDVKGGADDLIAAVKRLVAAEQPAADAKTILSEMSRFYPVDGPIAESRAVMCWNMVTAHLRAAGHERLDAERYRFIRDNMQDDYELPGGFYLPDHETSNWDRTIDAAMKAGAQGGGK